MTIKITIDEITENQIVSRYVRIVMQLKHVDINEYLQKMKLLRTLSRHGQYLRKSVG
jgi:hypothetical protein